MDKDEIEGVLRKENQTPADLRILKQAFRALISFSKEEPIVGLNSENVASILDGVLEALVSDRNIMPGRTL